MAKFEKGKDKTGGRTKGSANKATTKVRDSFANLLEDNLDQIKEDFTKLEPKDRIKLFLDLSKYVIPQLKQSDVKLEGSLDINDFDISKLYDRETKEDLE
tara:strand:- start:9741 stop:10040 length:300 start_codon:yes stop_codon:yes gene_type:complete